MRLSKVLASCLRATAQTATLLGILMLALTWIGISFYLSEQKSQASRAATQNAENLARAFEEQIVESVRSVDQALLFIRAQFKKDPENFDLDTWGKNEYYTSDMAIQLAFIGADGFMVSSNAASQSTSQRIDLGDREHFRVHADSNKDELFISKPVLGRVTKKWTIQLTRRVFMPDGSFGGVLVASLDPGYLARFYESIDIGQHGVIALIGKDSIIRAYGGQGADMLGKPVKAGGLLDAMTKSPAGLYEGQTDVDGDRLVAFRSVHSLPLVVTVGVDKLEVFKAYVASKEVVTRAGIGLTIVILVAMIWSIFQRIRLDATRRQLLDKSQALGLTLASMSEGILMVNADDQVVVINEQARHLLDIGDGFPCPFPLSELPALPAGGEIMVRHTRNTERNVHVGEMTVREGQILELHRVDIPTGGFVMTVTDVTRRKLVQRDIEEARDRAEAASRARAAFLATMSHEIRTPLGGVISMADLLSETQLDSDQRWYTHVARESAEHLLQLLDDILDISKFEAGRLTLESISFELPHAIQNVLEMLAPKARAKGLSIGCHIEPNLPKRVIGDPGRMRQILINLVGNAVKFTDRGHVLVRVTRVSRQPEGAVIKFEVEDTGIGIGKDGLQSLFQDFSQLDSTITRRFGGSGLGLSICKKLVTKMGGTIDVDSEFGRGTIFSFTLPMTIDENSSELAIRTLPGCAVAVLADSEFDRDCLVRQLSTCGATVEGFAKLETAAAWIDSVPLRSSEHPVLISVGSPSGIENWRREPEAGKRQPRRLLIGTGEQAINRDNATLAGFDDLLAMPVSAELLADLVHQLAHGAARAEMKLSNEAATAAQVSYKILLAEDNPTNQFALTRILEKLGATVTVVDNGQKAVNEVQKSRYDLVLMDMMMPVMDGLAAARSIRALPDPTGRMPILALTANAFPEDREATRQAGMNGFTTKPTTGARLSAAIMGVMDGVKESASMSPPTNENVAGDETFDTSAFDALREELGDEEFRMALDIFFDDVKERLTRIVDGGAQAVQNECHAMKSSAAMFGLSDFSSQCAVLEERARSGKPIDAEGLEKLQATIVTARRQVGLAA